MLLVPTAAAAAAVEDWSSLSVDAEALDTSTGTICLRADVDDLECLSGISLDDGSVLVVSDEGATFLLAS